MKTTYLYSLRFGLIRTMACGVLVTALLVAGGLVVMKRFDSYVNAIYISNTLPVGELAVLRASCIDARRQLWRAIAKPSPHDDRAIVPAVSSALATMNTAWTEYFPAGVSSDREKVAAAALLNRLPRFRELILTTAHLIAAGQHDAARTYLDGHLEFLEQIDRLMLEVVEANVEQAGRLARDSAQMLERSFEIAVALLGICLAVFFAFTVRLLRERDDARRTSRYSLWLVEQAFELTQDGVMITDARGNIEKVNPAFVRLTGYSESELIGSTPRLFSSGRHSPEFYRDMWQALRERGQWRGELWNRRKDGAIYYGSLAINGIRGPRGELSNFVAVCADITQRQLVQDQLGYLATHDALTGLANRTLLGERLTQAIARARRAGTHVAVMFLDLDGFKGVNDALGHGVGDATLIAVAQCLKAALRESDTVARLGGDEFAMVIEDVTEVDCVAPLAEKLVLAIGDLGANHDQRISVTASVGISLYPDDSVEHDKLLSIADENMYTAKRSGKNCYCFSDVQPRRAA